MQSSTEKKIATIFYVNVTRDCKTKCHWPSKMECPGINQSAFRIQTASYICFIGYPSQRGTISPAITSFCYLNSAYASLEVV